MRRGDTNHDYPPADRVFIREVLEEPSLPQNRSACDGRQEVPGQCSNQTGFRCHSPPVERFANDPGDSPNNRRDSASRNFKSLNGS